MAVKLLSFDSKLGDYQDQAGELIRLHRAGDPEALQIINRNHPRFLNPAIPWLPLDFSDEELRRAPFDPADAQLTVARRHAFRDWAALEAYVSAVTQPGSSVHQFEAAVEAVVNGDLHGLTAMLGAHPGLIHARSERITPSDPPRHRATLLHYVAANGVEAHRQKSPVNSAAIARALLAAGAIPDALSDMYGGSCTTMSMLVSSCHPAQAGVQIDVIHALVDFGASVEETGTGKWRSPLITALIFGYLPAAEALVKRGARIESIAAAAGLGRSAEAQLLLDRANAEERHLAVSLAAQHGHADILHLLLEAGEDPNRYNPDHPHSTPLHQAALKGHIEAVRMLAKWGAKVDLKDTIYHGTPLGWALHGGHEETIAFLRDYQT